MGSDILSGYLVSELSLMVGPSAGVQESFVGVWKTSPTMWWNWVQNALPWDNHQDAFLTENN